MSQLAVTGFITFNFLAFVSLLFWAALSDFLSFKIPNFISILLVLLYFFALLPSNWDFSQLVSNLTTAVGVLTICFLLFIRGYIGGGDAKLIAAISLWTGVEGLSTFIFFTTLSGGGIALLLISFRYFTLSEKLKKICCIKQLYDEKTYVPYAIAIAGGALATLDEVLVFAPLWKD
jgi:prepilin peptidase CpaA